MRAQVIPEYMRRSDAAAFLSISERTLSDWQRKRMVPFHRAGRKCILFSRGDLVKAMSKLRVDSVGG